MKFFKLACILVFTFVFVSAAPTVQEPDEIPIDDADKADIVYGSVDYAIDGKKKLQLR